MKVGVFCTMVTENLCNDAVMTAEYSWVILLMSIMADVFPLQDA